MQQQFSSFQPEQWLKHSDAFIAQVFSNALKSKAVIAVSGGIDSAVATSLLVRVLGAQNVIGVCLPYGEQDMSDAHTLMNHLGLSTDSQLMMDIKPIVAQSATIAGFSPDTTDVGQQLRLGNMMARSRMLLVFDLAKKIEALVCGTENKSEHYLGYFTRFGDAASDLEPLANLYKTQVRMVAEALQLPEVFLAKSPSAGLWPGQTDETELGFSYAEADIVLSELIDKKTARVQLAQQTSLSPETITKVLAQIDSSAFKLQVPYLPTD